MQKRRNVSIIFTKIGTFVGPLIAFGAWLMWIYEWASFLWIHPNYWFGIGLFIFFASLIGLSWPFISGQYDKDREEIERLRADNECWKEGIRFICEKELRELNSSFSIYDKIVSQVNALRKERERKG